MFRLSTRSDASRAAVVSQQAAEDRAVAATLQGKLRARRIYLSAPHAYAMEGIDNITDPTDWAGTAVSSLQPVESALRCEVCKEFFTTPVITSCAHTFCSICIRRCLTHDGKCPTCRAEDQPIRLRRNVVVEEIVSTFQKARPEILQMGREVLTVRRGGPAPSLKRKLKDVSIAEEHAEGTTTTRRKTRSQSRRGEVRSRSPSVEVISDDGSSYGETKESVADGKVHCPICMARMKEEEVSPHIDREHSEPLNAPTRPQPSMFGLTTNTRSPLNGSTTTKPPERLGGLSYGILNEAALRKKLQSLGIPSYGSKQAMIQRHQEWLNIWNANCDSRSPRPKHELMRDLDVWERTQGSQAQNTTDANRIMSKDFDNKAWTRSNGTDFKKLIAEVRAKKSQPPADSSSEAVPQSTDSVNGIANSANMASSPPNDDRTVGLDQVSKI